MLTHKHTPHTHECIYIYIYVPASQNINMNTINLRRVSFIHLHNLIIRTRYTSIYMRNVDIFIFFCGKCAMEFTRFPRRSTFSRVNSHRKKIHNHSARFFFLNVLSSTPNVLNLLSRWIYTLKFAVSAQNIKQIQVPQSIRYFCLLSHQNSLQKKKSQVHSLTHLIVGRFIIPCRTTTKFVGNILSLYFFYRFFLKILLLFLFCFDDDDNIDMWSYINISIAHLQFDSIFYSFIFCFDDFFLFIYIIFCCICGAAAAVAHLRGTLIHTHTSTHSRSHFIFNYLLLSLNNFFLLFALMVHQFSLSLVLNA